MVVVSVRVYTYVYVSVCVPGGSMNPPRGLSDAYYVGLTGCIDYVRINDRPLDLIAERTSTDEMQFCR